MKFSNRCKKGHGSLNTFLGNAALTTFLAASIALSAAGCAKAEKEQSGRIQETGHVADAKVLSSESALAADAEDLPPAPVPAADADVLSPGGMTAADAAAHGGKTGGFIIPEGTDLRTRIRPPEGFVRVGYEEGSFGDFVRSYPLLPDGSPVLLYNGQKKSTQTDHIAVFAMKLSDRDLQQCADSVMRMYAEYYWEKEEYDRIAFHFVNGFLCSYDKWRAGYRVKVGGSETAWIGTAKPDDSREGFEKYLDVVFAYSSTLSMGEESVPADLKDMRIGDVFLYSGSPGHVVMVADVCENEKGEKAFLLAQGYMPAQQFHLLTNPRHGEDPWYYLSEASWPFETPEYVFGGGAFRRMQY